MRMEPVMEATKLKTVIVLLQSHVPEKIWRQLALPLADAIAKLNAQDTEIRSLRDRLADAIEERDYWQHKWGNGSA